MPHHLKWLNLWNNYIIKTTVLVWLQVSLIIEKKNGMFNNSKIKWLKRTLSIYVYMLIN